MHEDHLAAGLRRSSAPAQFMEQEGVGQTVESIPADTLRVVGLRDRQASCDVRKIAMESRIEADKLRHAWPETSYGLDQLDFVR